MKSMIVLDNHNGILSNRTQWDCQGFEIGFTVVYLYIWVLRNHTNEVELLKLLSYNQAYQKTVTWNKETTRTVISLTLT